MKNKNELIFFYDLKSCKKRNESERGAHWTWSRMTAAMTLTLTAWLATRPAPHCATAHSGAKAEQGVAENKKSLSWNLEDIFEEERREILKY